MTEHVDSEAEIRRRVEQRLKKRGEFYIHLTAYVAVNLALWVVWLLMGSVFPWPLVLSLGWGVGLFIHGIDVYFATGSRLAAREAAIQREIERERERLYAEKPKRSRLVIADDGELMEVVEDEWEDRSKAKRR